MTTRQLMYSGMARKVRQGVALLGGTALLLGVVVPIGSATALPACTTTCYVDATTGNDANLGNSDSPFLTIQAGVTAVNASGTVRVAAGTYTISTAVDITKSLTLAGPFAGISPNAAGTPLIAEPSRTVPLEATIAPSGSNVALRIGAPDVVVDGFRFTDPGTAGASNVTIIGAGGVFGGAAPRVKVMNNNFDAVSRNAVYFDSATSMDGGVVDNNRVNYPTRAAGCGATGTLADTACGRQLFNLWQTDHLSFQHNTIIANAGNKDRVRVLNVASPNSPSLQSDSPAVNITIAYNTIRNSCVFTCFSIPIGANNVEITYNDVVLDSGTAVALHPTFTGGRVKVEHNVFTTAGGYAVTNENPTADLSKFTVNRNSFTAGGIGNASPTTINGTCNWWGSLTGPVAIQNAGASTKVPFLKTSNLNNPCPDLPPTVTIDTPILDNTKPVVITGTAVDDLSVVAIELAIYSSAGWWNGTAWQAAYTRFLPTSTTGLATGSATWSYTFSPPEIFGYYAIDAVAFDNMSGYSFSPYASFTIIDEVDPAMTINTPTPGATVTKPVTISGTASDNAGVGGVELAIYGHGQWWNGTVWQTEYVRVVATLTSPPESLPPGGPTYTNWTYSFNPPDTSGVFAVNGLVYDTSYRYVFTAYRYFQIPDTVNPTAAITNIATNYSLLSPVILTGTAADNVAVSSVLVAIYGNGGWWNGTTFQAGYTTVAATVVGAGTPSATWSYSFNPSVASAYAATAAALDSSGNYVYTPYFYFNIV